MSSMSPGNMSSQKQGASTTTKTLQHPDVIQAVEAFKLLIQSSYGPTGYLKTIQNSCGGQVTLTSSSSVLVKRLSVSKPILKLMLAAVEGHLAACSDGGLFCALLMTILVQSCSELDLHPVLCIGVNELLLKMCLEFLHSDQSCRININVSDVQTMLSLVRSVISTKPACGLTPRETDFISNLTLQAFLHGLPSSTEQSLRLPLVRYVLIEGKTPMDSTIVGGALIDSPQIPTYTRKKLKILRGDNIRVALFNTSMSGGGEGFPAVTMETTEGIHPEDASVDRLLSLGKHLVQQKIGLLACQKVVHPELKRFLRSHNVLTIDRLSLLHIDAVQLITGARMLGTLQANIPEDSLGILEDVTHRVMNGKSYLHLQNPSCPVCTYVLCNRTETSLEELKATCSVANHILGLTLSHPMALPGAGCFEACLAAHLKQQTGELNSEVFEDIGCTQSQFRTAADNFIHCIELIARSTEHGQDSQVTDNVHHHRWPLPLGENPSDWLEQCACGMRSFHKGSDWQLLGCKQQAELKGENTANKSSKPKEKTDLLEQSDGGEGLNGCDQQERIGAKAIGSPRLDNGAGLVLDSFVVKMNALHVAVETANIVLRIHQTIEDKGQ